jgi:hypothetical protein
MVAAAPPEPPLFTVGYRSQVFVAKRDGGAHRLTGGLDYHFAPVWSRRGLRIAVSTRRYVEIRSPSGGVKHRIRGGNSGSSPVAWAPHDRRIAFVSYTRQGKDRIASNLVVADIDGGHRRVIAQHADGYPAWLQDGTAVLYAHRKGIAWSIDAAPTRGGPARRLAADVWDPRALVSPTGEWILFRRQTFDERNGLWVVRPDGSGARRVIGHRYFTGSSYGWTLGGRAVFGGKRRSTHPIVTLLSGERRVLPVAFRSGQYEVSPDGRRVAWIGGSRFTTLRSARADGTGFRELARFRATGNSVDVDALAWSPDSRRIAVEPSKHSGD